MPHIIDIETQPLHIYSERPGVFYYVVAMMASALIAILAKLINIPHQLPAALAGIIIGIGSVHVQHFDELNVNADLLECMYVPLMIARVVYDMNHYLLRKSWLHIFIITVVCNGAFIAFFGLMLRLFTQRGAPLAHLELIAVLMAPNDSTELPLTDCVKNLETLMYGETLFTISACNILRIIISGYLELVVTRWYHVLTLLVRFVLFSILIGVSSGWLLQLLFRKLGNDELNAVAVYLAAAYFVFLFSEKLCSSSGAIATFVTLYLLSRQRAYFQRKTDYNVKLCLNVAFVIVQVLMTTYGVAKVVNTIYQLRAFNDIPVAIAIYTMGNVIRLLAFLLVAPILSRISYGLEFTSLVTLCWAVQKGPWQLAQLFISEHLYEKQGIVNEYRAYIVVYVIATCLINGPTLKFLLKAFGLIKFSNRRKSNIVILINLINSVGTKVLTKMKSNPLYADVNWTTVNLYTTIKNPYEDFVSAWTKDSVVCDVCHATVSLKPSKEEYNEHLKSITIRALKAQRMSFLEQHEYGLVTKHDLEFLLQVVDIAMDSTNMTINADELFSCFECKEKVPTRKTWKIANVKSDRKIPKSKLRKRCYFITKTLMFEVVIVIVVLIDLTVLILQLTLNATSTTTSICLTLTILCFLSYIAEATLRLLSFSVDSNAQGIRYYLKYHWNKLDAIVICIALIDIIFMIIATQQRENKFINNAKWLKLIICLKLLRIIPTLFIEITSYIERRRELKLMTYFGLAQAIVISCDEVIDGLPNLTEKSIIRAVIKSNLEQTRSTITQKMGFLEKTRPSLTTTVKTKKALDCIITQLNNGIADLKSSGLIDAFEFQKLKQTIMKKSKFVSKVHVLQVIPPALIYNEIPWFDAEPLLAEFIYKQVKNKIYNAGEVLCRVGDKPEGVYIIVAGYFKVTYYPTPELLMNLQENGELPTKEFLEYLRFDEMQTDFLSCGNRMCEFAVLTDRPNHCTIVSEAPSQVYIIPKEVFNIAKELSPDPVLGFSAKVWKTVVLGLSRHLLRTTTAYQSVAKQDADNALLRAVVPNIEYYNVLKLSSVVEFVLLLEGSVVDYNTREVYTAPRPLPTHVKKLLISTAKNSMQLTKAKLMFIPESSVDEYDMMLTIQEESELIPNYEHAILTDKINAKRKYDSHMFNLSKPTSGTLSNSNKLSSFNAGAIMYS